MLGSLLSGIFGLAQSGINAGSQSATNKANAEMNAATNAANLQMNKQTNLANYLINAATNKANRQLAEYEWSKNLEMWNLQNEYNSPTAQMQRLKDAGLNPNMMYGNISSGNASVLPKYQAPTQQGAVMTPGQARAYYKNAVQFDGITKALSAMSMFQDIESKKIGNELGRERIMSEIQNRLIQTDKNMRQWGLYQYDTSIRRNMVNKVLNDSLVSSERAMQLQRENRFWDKYGFSPNSTAGQVTNAIMNFITNNFPKSRRWLENGIRLNLN